MEPRTSMFNVQAPYAILARARCAWLEWLPTVAAWAAGTAYVVAKLPVVPTTTGDSTHYIEIAANRPPAYGWMLHALKSAGLVGPDYAGLPLVQTALISAGLLAFALQLTGLLGAPWLCAASVLVWMHVGTYEATKWVASEGLFLPLMLFGLAAAVAYARHGGTIHLVCAGLFSALATLTRTAGAVLLMVPVLLLVLDGGLRFGAVLRRVTVVVGISAVVLLGGMWANMQRHGHFEIGSNSGISLLGKGLLVLPPGPHGDPVLDGMAPWAAQAREAIGAAPGFMASLRAQAQAYEKLRWPAELPPGISLAEWVRARVDANEAQRWPSFFPMAGAFWPEVTAADERGLNAVAARVAHAVIASQPAAYLRLVARDWAALNVYPHFWPVGSGENSRLPPFDTCEANPSECWALFRYELPLYYSLAMLAVSAAGLSATVILILGWGLRALRRALAPPERLMVSLALVAQASLMATALFEAGLWRYVLPVHVIHIALAIWLAAKAGEAFRAAAARRSARLGG